MNHIRILLTLCALLCGQLAAADASRPNVVFILADDLGWGDLGCYGHPYARTPNLDRLAADGTRFTQFYATGVTCCPARTGLMTGRFPATFAKYPASFGFGDRITITELLKQNGYATGHFGKWHIGPETKPGTYGIDAISNGEEGGGRKRQRTVEGGRDAPIFDQAIRFIEQNKDRPFYVNVWGHISHHPINPPAKYVELFKDVRVDESKFNDYQRQKFALVRKFGGDVDDAVRRCLADIHSLDEDVGRLLAKLDELGLRENTLVVFSADQGAASPKDGMDETGAPKKGKPAKILGTDRERLRLNLMGYAGEPHRGGKQTDLEGGVRVPFIVRWPGRTPAGRVDEASVLSGADWLPTLCALTGTKLPALAFDGQDASAAFEGRAFARTGPLFWKTNADKSDPAMRWEHWKFRPSSRRRPEAELYDLRTDPGERENLAARQPAVVKALTEKIEAWLATLPAHYEKGDAKED